MKNLLKFVIYFFLAVIVLNILLVLISVKRVDRTSYKEKDFYKTMMDRLDSLKRNPRKPSTGKLSVGYALKNLTPSFPVATAGYGNRRGRDYTEVRDSVYVRALVIENQQQRVAIVSADLLIIPPLVTDRLEQKLKSIGFSLDNTYLNATHTHNSIGNWAEGVTGLLYGAYDTKVVEFIADKIVAAIDLAARNPLPALIKSGAVSIPEAVRNRVDKLGTVDSYARVLEIHRSDSIKLLMVSYNAHPTCLFSKDLSLSGDYPGKLVEELENSGYDFAMFLSGSVGSHGANPPEYGPTCIEWMATEISARVTNSKASFVLQEDSSLQFLRVPLELGEPQFKVARDWRFRPWVFNSLLGETDPHLTCLRIGNLVMLGTPCDFSGELSSKIDSVARLNGLQAMITSFNGDYIGYITKDSLYDVDHYETRLMNWYGPGNGAYLTESLQRLLESVK